jgi:hypothetical protein
MALQIMPSGWSALGLACLDVGPLLAVISKLENHMCLGFLISEARKTDKLEWREAEQNSYAHAGSPKWERLFRQWEPARRWRRNHSLVHVQHFNIETPANHQLLRLKPTDEPTVGSLMISHQTPMPRYSCVMARLATRRGNFTRRTTHESGRRIMRSRI